MQLEFIQKTLLEKIETRGVRNFEKLRIFLFHQFLTFFEYYEKL